MNKERSVTALPTKPFAATGRGRRLAQFVNSPLKSKVRIENKVIIFSIILFKHVKHYSILFGDVGWCLTSIGYRSVKIHATPSNSAAVTN